MSGIYDVGKKYFQNKVELGAWILSCCKWDVTRYFVPILYFKRHYSLDPSLAKILSSNLDQPWGVIGHWETKMYNSKRGHDHPQYWELWHVHILTLNLLIALHEFLQWTRGCILCNLTSKVGHCVLCLIGISQGTV
jgi:hypothetical protein